MKMTRERAEEIVKLNEINPPMFDLSWADEVRELAKSGMPEGEIAKRYGISTMRKRIEYGKIRLGEVAKKILAEPTA